MSPNTQITDAQEEYRLLSGAKKSHRPITGYRQIVVGFALILVVFGLFIPLPNEYRAVWFSRLQDTLHAPVFAFVVICLRLLFRRTLLQTLTMTCGVAVFIEVFQAGVGRSMSFTDLTYDACGLAAAFVGLQSTDPGRQLIPQWCHVTLATIFLLTPLVLESPVLIDACRAAREFPVQANFHSRWGIQRWYSSGIRMRRVQVDGEWRGEILNTSSQSYGSAILLPVIADWSGFDGVCCEFSFTGSPMQVLISARDGHGRIDVVRKYAAGTHHVCLNLRDPVTAGDLLHLDLTRIQSFHFALYNSPGRIALIHSVRLE